MGKKRKSSKKHKSKREEFRAIAEDGTLLATFLWGSDFKSSKEDKNDNDNCKQNQFDNSGANVDTRLWSLMLSSRQLHRKQEQISLKKQSKDEFCGNADCTPKINSLISFTSPGDKIGNGTVVNGTLTSNPQSKKYLSESSKQATQEVKIIMVKDSIGGVRYVEQMTLEGTCCSFFKRIFKTV